MKTLRTVLATFGMTTLVYGAFALFTVTIDPAFAGRSIYRMFRDTGFPALVVGIACLLSAAVIIFATAAFRDDAKARRAAADEDDEQFIEEETVPVDTYEEQWTPAVKKKSRAALKLEKDEPAPDLFADDDEPKLDETMFRKPKAEKTRQCLFCGTAFPVSQSVCPKCGKRAS